MRERDDFKVLSKHDSNHNAKVITRGETRE